MTVLRNERGLSLVEILVAMLLLTIALVGLAASFPLAMFGVTSGGYQTTATLLAQKCMDMAKSINYDDLTLAKLQAPDDPAQTHCQNGAVPSSPGFTMNVTVGAGPGTNTKLVTVQVGFVDQAGGSANITTLASILAQ
jgi:Tfp pilus assembly protein PilV